MSGLQRTPKSQPVLDLRQVSIEKPKKRPRHTPPAWLVGVLATLLLLGLVGLGYYFIANHPPQSSKSAMQQAVAQVGKLIILPEDETPTYGTVSDISKLKDQVFFQKAANGDEVLIYQKAKLTILYRKSINKIVNIGPIIAGSSGSPYVTSRFAILNGTPNPAFATAVAIKIQRLYPNAKIISNQPASRSYAKTIAIDLTKQNQPLDEQVADSLGIPAGKPPLGEAMPEGDILVIVGADFK